MNRQCIWICGLVWSILLAGCDDATSESTSDASHTQADTSSDDASTDITSSDIPSDTPSDANPDLTSSDIPSDTSTDPDIDTTSPPKTLDIQSLKPRTVPAPSPGEVVLSLAVSAPLVGKAITVALDGQTVPSSGPPEDLRFTPPSRALPGAADVSVTIEDITETLPKGLRYHLPLDSLQAPLRPSPSALPGVGHVSWAWSATADTNPLTDLVVLEIPPPQDDADPVPRTPHKLHLLAQPTEGFFSALGIHEIAVAQTQSLRLVAFPEGVVASPTGSLSNILYSTSEAGAALMRLRVDATTGGWSASEAARYATTDTPLDFTILRDLLSEQVLSLALRTDPTDSNKTLWLLDHTSGQETSLSALGLDAAFSDPSASPARLLDNGLRSVGPLPGPRPALALLEPAPSLSQPWRVAVLQLDLADVSLSDRQEITPARPVVSPDAFDARITDMNADGAPDLLYTARAADGFFVEVALGTREGGIVRLSPPRTLIAQQRRVDLDAFRALAADDGTTRMLIPLEVAPSGDSAQHWVHRVVVPVPVGISTDDPLRTIALPGAERVAHRPRNQAAAEGVPATAPAVPFGLDALWVFDGPQVLGVDVVSTLQNEPFSGGSLSAAGAAVLGSVAAPLSSGWSYVVTVCDMASVALTDTTRPVLMPSISAYRVLEPIGDGPSIGEPLLVAEALAGGVSLGHLESFGTPKPFALLDLRVGAGREPPRWARYTLGDPPSALQALTVSGGTPDPQEAPQLVASQAFVRDAQTLDLLTGVVPPVGTSLALSALNIASFASGLHNGHVAEVGDWWATDLDGDGQPEVVGVLLHRDTATGDASASESFIFDPSQALAPYRRLTFDGSPFIAVGVADFLGLGRPQVLGYTVGRAPVLHWIEGGQSVQIKPSDLGLLAPPVWTGPTAHFADLDGDGLSDWISAARDVSRAVSVAPSDGLGGVRYVGVLPSELGFGLLRPVAAPSSTPWPGVLMQFWDGLGWLSGTP